MGNGYVGSNGGPYKAGKIYCGYCGEFRKYGIDAASNSIAIVCSFCGIKLRQRGRHWIRKKEPKRY